MFFGQQDMERARDQSANVEDVNSAVHDRHEVSKHSSRERTLSAAIGTGSSSGRNRGRRGYWLPDARYFAGAHLQLQEKPVLRAFGIILSSRLTASLLFVAFSHGNGGAFISEPRAPAAGDTELL